MKITEDRRRKPASERLRIVGIPLHAPVIAELREFAAATARTQTAIVEGALAREFRRVAKLRGKRKSPT